MPKILIHQLSEDNLALKLEQVRINRKDQQSKNKIPSIYTTPSQQIAYFDQGTGAVFLFLYGFPGTPFPFQNQVDYFTEKGYYCLVPYYAWLRRIEPTEKRQQLHDLHHWDVR